MPTDAELHATLRFPRIFLYLAICLPLYVLSAGPVAWATNDGHHPAYLPDEFGIIYVPLKPLTHIPYFRRAFYWYTVELWDGFPSGYTTL